MWKAWYVLGGRTYTPGYTFSNRTKAENWLNVEWSKRRDPTYRDPSGTKTLRQFVDEDFWPAKRMGLAPRTVDTYESALKNYVYREVDPGTSAPFSLADMPMSQIDDSVIVAWHQACQQLGHPARLAKSWRLLSQVFSLAVDRRAVTNSPMHIKGAGAEHAAKRRALTHDEVKALVLAIEPRYRAMVVLSATCGLRYGEALGLQRQDLTLDAQLPHLTLRRTIVEVPNTEPTVGPLKAREEGETRTVPVPSGLVPILQKHLTQFVDPVDTSSSVAGKRHVSSCSPAHSPPHYGAVGKEREGDRTAV